ncbi:hypothetical protein O181_051619 [Austropuccinia psidii MF-1]|uniref:Integrase zinc-binding domain-containing protein n=1 Tax=Austropuccinia psidii MF-1 TaxID=1389203 RepID=A0A9Q3DZ58_9BASI|nr:hypothetical protein [Austropuccinia psidii MF-1]
MKTTNTHMLRWKVAIQEYRGNMTIIYKEGKGNTNADGLSRWPLENFKSNPAYDPEVAAKIPIHFMEIDRRKNFKFSEWAPESGTPESGYTDSEKYRCPELESQLEEPWLRDYRDNRFFLIDGLPYHREKHTSALTVVDRDHISLILQGFHDCPYMGHMGEDRTKERVESTAWWPKWEQELSEYINTCERFQQANRKHGKKYGLLQHIEEPKHPWETINMDWVTGLVPGGKENFNAFLIIVYRENAVEVRLTEEFYRKHPVFPVSLVKPYFQTGEDKFPSRNKNPTPPGIVEVEDTPGPVKKIIKARKMRLNGKDQRQYLIRFKNWTEDRDKWLAEDAIPDGNLHLRRFRASRRNEQSYQ